MLDEVEITGAQFVTLNPDAAADADGARSLRTQFVFAGRLRFHDVPDFDALSFGDTRGAEPIPGGLSYSNLVIHMDYELSAVGVATNTRFVFDAQDMAIDIASSSARPQSLVAHFPLKFKGFVQGQSGSTPSGLGYLAVATPLTESPLLYPWYALQYELNLGTFGALASHAGFTASVLIGWSGGAGPERLYRHPDPRREPREPVLLDRGAAGSVDRRHPPHRGGLAARRHRLHPWCSPISRCACSA